MQLGLLGPFEVRLDGGPPLALGGARQRSLLAILALRPNEVVSTDQLVDQLWGERPPATAVHTVQVFVSRLRGVLGSAGESLITRPPGYVLEVAVDDIDAERCERLYAGARAALAAGRAAEGAARLREANALWRGAPLADFTYEPFAQATIARLEELRLSCREELIEAELALGHHAEVVADLEALVREQPFRERPRGQLMLALYRSGRQAEALEAFQDARRSLVEELAVEPSEALRGLEEAILRQDESLQLPAEPVAAAPETRDQETEPPPPPTPEMLRKTATVLAARIEAAPGADPERARALVRAARERAEAVILSHGGTFLPGLGGELVGVFGVPSTREDDVLRALRAAEELRVAVAALSAEDEGDPVVTIGLDTGEVVAESSAEVFGQPLARGMTLAREARSAEVLLSDDTRRLASKAVRTEPPEAGRGWRLLEVVGEAGTPSPQATAMVGRHSELAAARAAFDRAASGQELHLLTVVGDAGIGKTRLCDELIRQLDDTATVLRGRCLSYGDGVAFWPLREALTGAAGGESREAIRALLHGDEDADLVAAVAAGAIGAGVGDGTPEQIPWAFRRLLAALARDAPLVLVVEDAHWAEPALLELIDYLVDWLTAPVLVICLARPELLESHPGWGGGRRRVSSLVLGPLGEDEALRLLDAHLAGRELNRTQRQRILETAEGNPLFVEQLLALSAEDPWWSQDSEIPATLQTLLAARLDRLGPGERAVIERAAVIGRGFWPAAITELLPPEARPPAAQHLRTLVHRGLIHPDRSTLPGEEELRFHHILIRDVAYHSTAKTLRAQLHEQFADWLAARPGVSEEFVGYHLEQAVAYRRELGPVDSQLVALAARGGEQLTTAGRRALARGDSNASSRLLQSSASLFELSGALRPDVLLDLGVALGESGDLEAAEHALEAAREQAQKTNLEALGARAAIELSARHALVDPSLRVREMLAVADQARAVFERLGDEGGLARAWEHVAQAHWARCHCAEMELVLERALKHAERAGASFMESRILSSLATATVFGPRSVSDGMRRCEAILERAHEDLFLTAVTETMLAVLEAMDGEFETARDRFARCKQRLEEVGLGVTASLLTMYRAIIELMAGTPEKAEREMAEAYSVVEQTGDRSRQATMAGLLARLHCALGRYDEAERCSVLCEEAASDDDVGSQILWRGVRSRVLVRTGDASAAEKLARSAVTLAEETDLLMVHGAALEDRADVTAALGRPAEAMADLDRAIALYQRKGMRASADAARHARVSLARLAEASSIS